MDNVRGSIDLLKLEKAGIASIHGKRCIVIPIEENDIYITADENLKAKGAFLGLSVVARREVSKYGKTHYVRQDFSKDYREAVGQEAIKNKPFLGDMQVFFFENKNAAQSIKTDEVQVQQEPGDDLPF